MPLERHDESAPSVWTLFARSEARWETHVIGLAGALGLDFADEFTTCAVTKTSGTTTLIVTNADGAPFLRVSRLGGGERQRLLAEAPRWSEEVRTRAAQDYAFRIEFRLPVGSSRRTVFLTTLALKLDGVFSADPSEVLSDPEEGELEAVQPPKDAPRDVTNRSSTSTTAKETKPSPEGADAKHPNADVFGAWRRALAFTGVALIVPLFGILCVALLLLHGIRGAWVQRLGLTADSAPLIGLGLFVFSAALLYRLSCLEKGFPEHRLEQPTFWDRLNLLCRLSFGVVILSGIVVGIFDNTYIPPFLSGILALALGAAWFGFGPENIIVRWFSTVKIALFWYYLFGTILTLAVIAEGAKALIVRKDWERVSPELPLFEPLSVAVGEDALFVANSGSARASYLLHPRAKTFRRFRQEPDDGTSLSHDPFRNWVWMTHDHGGRTSFFDLKKELWYEFESPPGEAYYLSAGEDRAVLLHEAGAFARNPKVEAETFYTPARPGEAVAAEVARFGGLSKTLVRRSTKAGGGPCRRLLSAYRDPKNEQRFFVGCAAEGVWFTENGGLSFRSLGLRGTEIVGLWADTSRREVIATVHAMLFHEGIFRRRF